MPVRTYDPALIQASFLGVQLTGFAPDTFIEVTMNSDSYMLMVGAGGDTARARSQDRSGQIKITLMQSSAVNDLLSAIEAADHASGTGVGSFSLTDGFGTSQVSAPNAWVKKLPDGGFGKEIGTREWVLESDFIDNFIGGALLA